jgi:aspartyl-tRNA(Asn)/glutamyl-tRNA(Gln) amidotransferase subunit C
MSLTSEQVRWIAHLARLDLNEAELLALTRDLSAIVDYVKQLQEVDTEGIEPLAHVMEIENVFRLDEPAPSLPVEAALTNAPDRQGDFFGVPAVLD